MVLRCCTSIVTIDLKIFLHCMKNNSFNAHNVIEMQLMVTVFKCDPWFYYFEMCNIILHWSYFTFQPFGLNRVHGKKCKGFVYSLEQLTVECHVLLLECEKCYFKTFCRKNVEYSSY